MMEAFVTLGLHGFAVLVALGTGAAAEQRDPAMMRFGAALIATSFALAIALRVLP